MNAGEKNSLSIIHNIGFTNTAVQKEKRIALPDEILNGYLSQRQIEDFTKAETGIFSITVYAKKPNSCYTPGCGD